MDDQEVRFKLSDNHNWWWIGFRFGMGFGLAIFIFALLGAVLAHLWHHQQMDQTNEMFRHAYGPPPAAQTQEPPAQPAASAQPAPAAAQPPPVVHVPGRDQATCMALTHNVINNEFQRCIEGYDEPAKGSEPPPAAADEKPPQ